MHLSAIVPASLSPLRRLAAAVAGLTLLIGALALPAGARAASFDPNGFQFTSDTYHVNESAGQAVITIERSPATAGQEAQIRYITMGVPLGTAAAPYDFTPQKAMLDFPAGATSETFTVPIVDHGVSSAPKTIQLSLFGPSSWPVPIGLGTVSVATLVIDNNDPVSPRDPANPLGLAGIAAAGGPARANPLAGADFFVDHQSEAALAAAQFPALSTIARQPGTARFGSFSWPDAGVAVSHYLARAAVQEPGTVPMLATYRIVDGHCGHWADPPADQQSYHDFIERFAAGIGSYRAVLFLEMDSLITSPCLSPAGLTVRMNELRDAVAVLGAHCPRLVIYLDAGAADALPARRAARLLLRAGVALTQGFFLNSTHFDWTSREIKYGEQISRLTGGKHFVINTGEAGQGPLVPRDRVHQGNEVLCNPAGRGLGPLPTSHTGYPNLDAFAWTSNPGESGGPCVPGAPATGAYWPAYGAGLVARADFRVR